jgi:hypothetical protein
LSALAGGEAFGTGVGSAARYNVARLMEKYGDAKLPELLQKLAQCHKDPLSMRDRCRVRYGEDSRLS